MSLSFTIEKTDSDSKARAATIETKRGVIQTPIFMPVGTLGTVKGVHQRELENDINAPIILGNAYHLYLRPGLPILENAGGLHKFMNWKRFMLTDSGGYQVFSLAQTRKISEEGVKFSSHIDGSKHFLSPESSIDIQRSIGADIMMAFDECTHFPIDHGLAKKSMDLTHRWLKRCIAQFNSTQHKYEFPQNLFHIVQGSTFKDLRTESANFIADQNAVGNAIGGLSVGEPAEVMYEMTELVCEILPADKPRYLMGVGTPANILESIALGVDMFDCVMPTRNARHGILYTTEGIVNIKNEKWKNSSESINGQPLSFVDEYYSKGYLSHLLRSKELLAGQIASVNNLAFYLWLVREARKHILQGDFAFWKKEMAEKLSQRL
ncbi:MAG: tRNA guanosine(34) transglycosylase Tgt [Bacteroidetes bacterium]|nr:tRNA guanosine(34) transglycosylase Tgt [Bacteroidota bacterium]MBT3421175.1 tRNA guanosine(34) transglycosylase Tgt [Bacteroidota bacterium]MBT3933392.1 tRNA guanosine(34) transglycosylase Tgt [Bacteroidota bacterium]MBT4338508.1 tRNA guanosine(34) transglycosylase Tgt [Bacteroidota bacterium]MBT4728121.1 tRNA guanosine(34) transglycosylase Tgt [Bacteroidota bacterium]